MGNIVFINMGQSPPSSSYNYSQIGLPFYQGKSEFSDIYPVVEKYCSEPIKIVDSDDVLISVRAPIGPTNLVKYKSCIGRGLAGIKAFGGMSGKFLLYQFRTLEKELQEQGTGTTFKSISKLNIGAYKFKNSTSSSPLNWEIINKCDTTKTLQAILFEFKMLK